MVHESPNAKRGLTIAEAATYVGLHRTTIYRLARNGKLKIRKIGGRSILLREDLDALLESAPIVDFEAEAA